MFLFLCPGPGLGDLVLMGLVFIGLPILVIALLVTLFSRKNRFPYNLP
jgi:hypothetical protein